MKTLNFKLQLCILNFAFLIILLLPHFAEAGLIVKAPPYIGFPLVFRSEFRHFDWTRDHEQVLKRN